MTSWYSTEPRERSIKLISDNINRTQVVIRVWQTWTCKRAKQICSAVLLLKRLFWYISLKVPRHREQTYLRSWGRTVAFDAQLNMRMNKQKSEKAKKWKSPLMCLYCQPAAASCAVTSSSIAAVRRSPSSYVSSLLGSSSSSSEILSIVLVSVLGRETILFFCSSPVLTVYILQLPVRKRRRSGSYNFFFLHHLSLE